MLSSQHARYSDPKNYAQTTSICCNPRSHLKPIGVFLSECWGFSATLHEHLGFIDSGNHQISSWKSGHSGDGVLVHHLWWGTETLVDGERKYAAGSRKVAQRNFELEGRDFRRWIGIADIKQKHTKLWWQAYHVWSTYPSFNSVETSVKPLEDVVEFRGSNQLAYKIPSTRFNVEIESNIAIGDTIFHVITVFGLYLC